MKDFKNISWKRMLFINQVVQALPNNMVAGLKNKRLLEVVEP